MGAKPTILVLIGVFLPGYKAGGPVSSVANIVSQLGDEFNFRILTSDRDLGDVAPYSDISTDRWVLAYGAQVRYCSAAMQSAQAIAMTIRETPHDLLYLNSFFSSRFTVSPLLTRRLGILPSVPTLLAPRGEFSPGALALKTMKKRAYICAGQAIGMFKGLLWHASNEPEARDITTTLGIDKTRIYIATDLAASLPKKPPPHVTRAPGTPLRVVFLSRVSPMKNLDFALEVLSGVDLPIIFSIIGPEEDAEYSMYCRRLANRLPKNIMVEWIGSLPPQDVPKALAGYDLLFLPTRGENFGHVIVEALGAGTPVLLSNTTIWRGLEQLGVGNDLALDDTERFRSALRTAWHRDPAQAAEMRNRSAKFARARQRSSAEIDANRNLFRAVLSGA